MLSRAFLNNMPHLHYFYEVEWKFQYLEERSKSVPKTLYVALMKLERNFKEITNYASLIFSSKEFPYMLFLGDASNFALDACPLDTNLKKTPFFLVKAAHHGTHYGNILNNIKTKFLVFSRNKNLKLREEYFSNIEWQIIIDTSKHGSCLIFENSNQNWTK